jgi:hypothetical protein
MILPMLSILISCIVPGVIFGTIIFSLQHIESRAVQIVLGIVCIVLLAFITWGAVVVFLMTIVHPAS